MMRNKKWMLLVSSVVILLPILFGLVFWNYLPEQMTTHWGFSGNADGWSSRSFGVLGLPFILLLVHWFCLWVTSKDKKNKEQSKEVSNFVFWICPVISLFTSGIIYATAFEWDFNIGSITLFFIGLMFVVVGSYLPKCKQNHTIGIRIKWTLENEENWNATHRIGGKLWVIGGLLLMACIFLPKNVFVGAFAVLFAIFVLLPLLYSYWFYKKQVKEGTWKVEEGQESKNSRKILIVNLIFTVAILIFVGVICFTGEIEVQYGDTSFTIEASYWDDLTVEYDAIESVEYRENFNKGYRVNGFGSPKLSMGLFKNDEFGVYTLYSYTENDDCVVMKVNGKVLVVGDTENGRAREIYEEFMARQ